MKLIPTKEYLLLIDKAAVIEINDYVLSLINKPTIIDICTDCDEHAINGIAIKWTVRKDCSKIIAYYPLTKESKELDLPLLPNPFKEINYELLAWNWLDNNENYIPNRDTKEFEIGFAQGYKAAQSKQFSLEDMEKAILNACIGTAGGQSPDELTDIIIRSLSTQQLPKEFIMKQGYIRNSENKQVLIGEYKY